MKYRKWDSKTKAKIVLEGLQNYVTTIRYHKINTTTGLKSSSQNLIKLLTLQENQEKNNVLLMKIKSSNEL